LEPLLLTKYFVLKRSIATSEAQERKHPMLSKITDPARPIFHAPTCLSELLHTVSVAKPTDVIAVPAILLGELLDAQVPSSPPSPGRLWIRPSEALARLPVGPTKLNKMLATGEVVSKLLGGCRLIFAPSLDAVGDPQGRLKRGRPRKLSATPPSQPIEVRRRGRPRRDAGATR
jgi:hypothetical protein